MYIPKGKLDPKIYYTNGGDYLLSTNKSLYVGYYHKDLLGGVWTGETHTVDSIRLINPFSNTSINSTGINITQPDTSTYFSLNNYQPNSYSTNIPPNDSLPPSVSDYNQTYYTRYILQFLLSSKPYFVETSKQTYFKSQNYDDSKYFKYVEVLWKIKGPLYDIIENNITVKGGIIDSNTRSIQQAEQTMPGISDYLNNLLLYAEIEN